MSKEDTNMAPELEALAAKFHEMSSAVMDEKRKAIRAEAWDEGMKQGKKQGRIEGRIEGKKEGEKQGISLALNRLCEIGILAKEDLETLKMEIYVSAKEKMVS